MARLVSALDGDVVALGLTFFQVIAPFLMPLFLAGSSPFSQSIYRGFSSGRESHRGGRPALTTIVDLVLILASSLHLSGGPPVV